jgi:hypothetical protein
LSAANHEPERLRVDARSERVSARVKGLAGALAIGSGVWLLALPHPLAWPFAFAGIVFGALWLRRAFVQPRSEGDYLELGRDALEQCEAGDTRRVAWQDIVAIDVDEDRLAVRIDSGEPTPLLIEPRYGCDVYALRDMLQWTWHAASDRDSHGATPPQRTS